MKTRYWLKEKRNQKNITQKAVAEHLRVATHHYYMLESGRRNPSVPTAQKLGKLLGFDWTRFFE